MHSKIDDDEVKYKPFHIYLSTKWLFMLFFLELRFVPFRSVSFQGATAAKKTMGFCEKAYDL